MSTDTTNKPRTGKRARRAGGGRVTAVPRSLAGPASLFAGCLLALCGAFKIVYDLILLAMFRHVKAPEEAIIPKEDP